MKVAVFSTKYYEREYLNNYNKENRHQLTFFEMALNTQTVYLVTAFDAVCIQLTDIIDTAVIAKLSKSGIKLIALRSAGYDNVDIKAALKSKITIMRVPAYSPQAIAEHAVALILTLDRKTHKAYNRVRENNFSLQNLMGFNLDGKTIGVVGTGKIGAVFCKIMLGFGCKIIAFDLIESKVLIRKGVHYNTFDKLLENSDIISIHCPLTPKTRHLFNKKAFSKMKPGMMLINTSRGALINTSDAIIALKKRIIGYLGIDVYEGEEKIFFKDLSAAVIKDDLIERLMSFNNVLITPHQAFFTYEALSEIARITIENFSNFENDVHLENKIN
ncbi:2-hydroxyacid dehydrogenase [Flavobacterium sp. AC]|uniref:2-hydroxyacid dehydrogenase n=1 Tax=Flavobacterium azizsancarii TaxID=2961580 RepID=A0ABT4WG45_9FLAO|nr:2-hydroxyacid dehydrogenase [Flavobacterium azizsancarii]MDA6071569.1 2-hydroxyacid dehydrogenase [Flavobacterium azizsancarii]